MAEAVWFVVKMLGMWYLAFAGLFFAILFAGGALTEEPRLPLWVGLVASLFWPGLFVAPRFVKWRDGERGGVL